MSQISLGPFQPCHSRLPVKIRRAESWQTGRQNHLGCSQAPHQEPQEHVPSPQHGKSGSSYCSWRHIPFPPAEGLRPERGACPLPSGSSLAPSPHSDSQSPPHVSTNHLPREGEGFRDWYVIPLTRAVGWGPEQASIQSAHSSPGTCAESSRDPTWLTKLLQRLEPHSLPAA